MNKVLVVDDNSNERNGLSRLLEQAGYEVRTAADGVEAFQKVQNDRFDLMLLDIWMPRMDGLELLARLPKESRPTAMVITGDESFETILRSLREQVCLFVPKPFQPRDLMQLIRDTLESPGGRDPILVLSAEPNWVQLRFTCEMQTATRVENVVEQLNKSLPFEFREPVRAAFHELLMNAVEWGGHLNPEALAQVDYLRTPKLVMCRIADPGKGFDPERLEHTEITIDTMEPIAHGDAREKKGLRPGGYGIRLAKSLVDDLVYNQAHNEVTIFKYLN
jgi:CheY-like chemotaxis protein/anti-sigma regulatory factor (Ser/Thr protein kinase)